MSYQKDPIYEIMQGILYAVVTVAWAIIAAIGSLFFKLLQNDSMSGVTKNRSG